MLSSLVLANFYTTDDRFPFPQSFVGSNLFGDGKFVKKCFSMEDVALLSARSRFEVRFRLSTQLRFFDLSSVSHQALIPNFTISLNDLENDRSVEQMLDYLQEISGLINAVSGDNVQYITQAAYYDVVGGYVTYQNRYYSLLKC